VRNKDIAQAAGVTPAGAKRRNDFLQSVGLLERRRRGKEVQYCTTILSYLVNLGLAEENRAPSMGVIYTYLELTKPYSEKILQDLQIGRPEPSKTGRKAEEAIIHRACEDGKAFFGLIAYLWPSDTLSQIHLDLPGFNRTGTRILTINDIVLPLPRLREEEYDKMLNARRNRQGRQGKQGGTQPEAGMEDAKESLLRSLMTGRARVADYGEQEATVHQILAVSRSGGREYLSALSKLKETLTSWQTKGPLLPVITQALEGVIDGFRKIGVTPGPAPVPAPVGLPSFPIFDPFNENRYAEIRRRFTAG